MFYSNNLTTWTTPLPKLEDGSYMFYYNDLKEWTTPLPKLQNGTYMFYNNDFTSFDVDLPELTDGYEMFYYCTKLTSFTGDTPKLTRGNYMFERCPIVHFRGNLKQLTSGTRMFDYAKFDAETVQYVVNQLKDNQCTYNSSITLGVDKSFFEDQTIRHILGIYAGDEQPGEDKKVARKYSYSKITNAKGKKWSVTTYWN